MKASEKQLKALRLVADGIFHPTIIKENDGWHARWCASTNDNDKSINHWVDTVVRNSAITCLTRNAETLHHDTLHDAWLMALKSESGLIKWDDKECEEFSQELNEWSRSAIVDLKSRSELAFALETKKNKFFLCSNIPTKINTLRALGEATKFFPPLRGLRKTSKTKLSTEISQAEAESFLRSGARELLNAGYKLKNDKLSSSISASADLMPLSDTNDLNVNIKPVHAKIVIKIAGEVVSAAEIKFLLDQESSLVYFREHWIEVNREELKEALHMLEKNDGKKLSSNEALAFVSGIGAFSRLNLEEIRAHGWLRGLVNELKSAHILPEIKSIAGLKADLRGYQKRGVAWIKFLTDNGFGALLADDMGLGKTIQTISWILLAKKSAKKLPFLIVAPLTLLGNWKHEFAKFAPSLKVYTHQGTTREMTTGLKKLVTNTDVVITSYSLLVKDYSILREISWAALVLDEAQIIKNPDTQTARAACSLGAPRRLALTGTPIENSVADVWSIEEFLNPTFLGDKKTFRDKFEKPIAMDEQSIASKKLRHALEPFVLRRLKSDPEIASELGEKREIKEYCPLSLSQRTAYENALESYRICERTSGDNFALLTQLKLICDGAGKFERLCELLETIFSNGESALIFTQYAKVGSKLKEALDKKFNKRFPFLHGAIEARAREKEIASFNNDKKPTAFILSLRVGGFGLNLTKATHVIHFDRWWNPAVEDQATDRAYRIGQTGTVFVHTFITEGTLEEHIDEILERKSRIAGTLVATGESFLKSLSPKAFNKIVALDK